MAKIGLFYGSKRGNTADAAMTIKESFDQVEPDLVEVHNVKRIELSKMNEYEKIILGSSTWEAGQLQMHWKRAFPQMDEIDLHGKQVAVFGFGNQSEFNTTFQGGIAILSQKARERGADLVGLWPIDGYQVADCPAVEDGHFVGLALDNTNQHELTKERIQTWVQQLISEFGLG
ncbi:MAG: flavodoxin [Chloroflexaceae bacterium]|nr:flavodoxin [Chloroflexaceae bacterium]